MNISSWVKLILIVALSELAGFVGSTFMTPQSSAWFSGLAKPQYMPPSWAFAPVWIILYALMGIAAFLVWRRGVQDKNVKKALGLFIFQLALNAMWTYFFFGKQDLVGSLIDMVILWWAIIGTMVLFARTSKLAMALLIPYILWVSFAACLNFTIAALNLSA